MELIELVLSYKNLLISGLKETVIMVLASIAVAVIFGLPLGIITNITRKKEDNLLVIIHKFFNIFINIGRSIPFVILMVAVIPLTRIIAGTSIGTRAAVVPLSLAAIPFMGRVVDNALLEIDNGVIEAAKSMGAGSFQIIFQVMIPETLPALILGITLTTVNLISYSAMAGAIGGGGLGDIAIRYGYQRFKPVVLIETIVILILLVNIVQWTGEKTADYFDHT